MEQNETLDSMSTRFSSIINELKNLGKTFDSEEIARKILRSLSKRWRPKVTIMEECRDLSELSNQELIGALMAHEITLDEDNAEASSSKKMALQAETSEKQDSDPEVETVLFAKNFKNKFFNRKQGKTPNNNTNKTSKKTFESKGSFSNRGCFKCGDTDHMIKDCPTWKKIKDKNQRDKTKKELKHVMMAYCWGDLDIEDDESEEEVANLCLSNVSLDLISDSDNESESFNTEMCLVGDSDSDDEEDVSYLELKKQVKKLSKSSLVKYFEESLDHCHEQSLELKDLKEQILDIAEENQLLKAKAKKLKSKVTATPATTSDTTNVEKATLESKQLKDVEANMIKAKKQHVEEKFILNKRFNDFCENLEKNNSSKDSNVDHSKCEKEIQSFKELLLHARKVHDKWEGSTKVLNFLTEQSDNNMKMGLGHECYSRRDHDKCKSNPSDCDFRRRKYVNLPEYLICNYCGHTRHVQDNCVKYANDNINQDNFVRECDVSSVDESEPKPEHKEIRNNEFRWSYDMAFDYTTKPSRSVKPIVNQNQSPKPRVSHDHRRPRQPYVTTRKIIRQIIVKENNQWYLDSGCSRHMTGNKIFFLSLKPFDGDKVTFGDNKKGKIVALVKEDVDCVPIWIRMYGLNLKFWGPALRKIVGLVETPVRLDIDTQEKNLLMLC
ncbi:uncharacterized protein LOC141619454 [Silene latifolia]|uniref:uncharacterized protein LOC141619454 n=1 Tax=Silene latifolia TaxID=37657 RepID=UPI003D77B3AC